MATENTLTSVYQCDSDLKRAFEAQVNFFFKVMCLKYSSSDYHITGDEKLSITIDPSIPEGAVGSRGATSRNY